MPVIYNNEVWYVVASSAARHCISRNGEVRWIDKDDAR
jgi:hypothetical protein